MKRVNFRWLRWISGIALFVIGGCSPEWKVGVNNQELLDSLVGTGTKIIFQISTTAENQSINLVVTGLIHQLDFGDGETRAQAGGTAETSIPHTYKTPGVYRLSFEDGNLTTLSLESARVSQVRGLSNLKNINSLFLVGNQLTSFTQTLPDSLRSLDLAGNQLTSFTQTLPAGLEQLRLAGNQLTSFTQTLPAGLRFLNLGDNQLTSFTQTLPAGLQILVLSGNQLTSFTQTLPAGLLSLYLPNNQLTSFTQTLPAGLQGLHLTGNQLTSFTQTLPAGLGFLNLGNNQLTSFTQTLPAGLQILELSGNQLTSFTQTLPEWLEYLYLGNNQLPSAVINSILSKLVINNSKNGNFQFQNQNPPAPPTGQGVTDKSTLISRGNNVQTD